MISIGMMIGDRYEILEKIGTGGMSDVYKAKCHKLNRYVAVKVLKQEFSENTNFVSKFRVEAQAAARLTHPNIVNVYDVGEEDGIHYIVMELVEGITLKNYIEKKARLSVKEASSIAIQVSMGIEAAHNNHIIHRDIKPQNIMISKEGKVKIADFGIAKAATSNTITSNVMGSVHYTSPEQARGGFSDARSDIYSLGCTMYEMLTGRVPFDGETTVAIAIKHIQEEMPSPREFVSEIPVCVEQIIFKCTQKSPDRRYQSMSELIADLKKSLISPNENFVKIIPAETGGATKMISEADIAEIKQRTGQIIIQEPDLLNSEVESTSARNRYEEEIDDEEDVRTAPAPKKSSRYDEEDSYEEEDREEEDDSDYDEYDDEYDDGDLDPKMERITTILAIVAAVIIGVLALVLVANALGIFKSTPKQEEILEDEYQEEVNDGMVTMINVVGMDVEDAKKALNDLGLGVSVTKEESSEYEVGQVISQSEGEEEAVPLHTQIDLVVSSGTNTVEVSDVVGLSEENAKSSLEALGFSVVVTSDYSEDVENGLVMSQEPTAKSQAEPNATITITVSAGKKVIKQAVPDLRGMTESAAKDKLAEYKLKCGTVSEKYSDTVTEGCVVSQSFDPGTEIEEGSTVNIQLSAGPEKKTYGYVARLDAPTGYTDGKVTIKITDGDGNSKSFTTEEFPCSVNETGFTTASGTITYTYTTVETQTKTDEETGMEYDEEVQQEVTTSPASVAFEQE